MRARRCLARKGCDPRHAPGTVLDFFDRDEVLRVYYPEEAQIAPLALCNARSVAPADLVASSIFYPRRQSEIYQLLHNTRHEWANFSTMTPEEVPIFKQFDSMELACFTSHAAIEHPRAPAGWPPRASVEIRCLLVFD